MEITATEIRKLVDGPHTAPVTSVYLNVDGARHPRAADYLTRLDGLLREVRRSAGQQNGQEGPASADAEAIRRWVAEEFDRSGVKGLAVFASEGEILETVASALSLRNVARHNSHPYVVPLEALLGRSHHIGLALVDRDTGRFFSYQLGRAQEHDPIESEVHGQHDQGGLSQANYQRSIAQDVLTHLKSAAERLRKLHEARPFDALVIAGPEPEAKEFVKQLRPNLMEVTHGEPVRMPDRVSLDDVRKHLEEVEQDLVSARRRELLDRLAAAVGQGGRAARGIRHVVEAANAKSIEVLFAVEGAGQPGWRSDTGALALHRAEAQAYGGAVEEVDDLIDEIIEEAVRSGAQLEFFRDAERLDGDPVAALLRF